MCFCMTGRILLCRHKRKEAGISINDARKKGADEESGSLFSIYIIAQKSEKFKTGMMKRAVL